MFPCDEVPIRYWMNAASGTGYNCAARGYLAALRSIGYSPRNLLTAPTVGVDYQEDAACDWTAPYLQGSCSGPGVNIVHSNIRSLGEFWTKGWYNIAIVIWETDRLPKAKIRNAFGEEYTVVEALQKFDEIWTPTRWLARMIERELEAAATNGGQTPPVVVVPHALQPEILDAAERYAKQPTPMSSTVVGFYAAGAWNARKDLAEVVRSYHDCGWGIENPVQLSIYSVPPARDRGMIAAHSQMVDREVKTLRSMLPDPLGAPAIGVHTIYVDNKAMAARHAVEDVFVSASHGEAFGLWQLEAAAFGNFVIGGGPWIEELAEVAGTFDNGGAVLSIPTDSCPVGYVPDAWGYEQGQEWWTAKRPKDLSWTMRMIEESLRGNRSNGLARTGRPKASDDCAVNVREWYSPFRIGKLIAERLEAAREKLKHSTTTPELTRGVRGKRDERRDDYDQADANEEDDFWNAECMFGGARKVTRFKSLNYEPYAAGPRPGKDPSPSKRDDLREAIAEACAKEVGIDPDGAIGRGCPKAPRGGIVPAPRQKTAVELVGAIASKARSAVASKVKQIAQRLLS